MARSYVIGRAIAYQRNGDAARSLQLMNAAVAANGRDPELWLFRGRYRTERGDCRGAAADFDQATSLAPANPAAYSASGVAKLCLGDRAGARRAFERALQLDPTPTENPRVSLDAGALTGNEVTDAPLPRRRGCSAVIHGRAARGATGRVTTLPVREHIEAMRHLRLGQDHMHAEQWDKAETEFKAAVEAGADAGDGALRLWARCT